MIRGSRLGKKCDTEYPDFDRLLYPSIIQTPSSSHYKFGAWQNSEVAGRKVILQIELKYCFSNVFAQSPLLRLHTT